MLLAIFQVIIAFHFSVILEVLKMNMYIINNKIFGSAYLNIKSQENKSHDYFLKLNEIGESELPIEQENSCKLLCMKLQTVVRIGNTNFSLF